MILNLCCDILIIIYEFKIFKFEFFIFYFIFLDFLARHQYFVILGHKAIL